MSNMDKRTISLPAEHAAYVDRLVGSGLYASASEVVRAGLRALQERDAAVEKWLREDVATTYDAMKADPERALSVDDGDSELRAAIERGLDDLRAGRVVGHDEAMSEIRSRIRKVQETL
jgi:antitoxin ParD1/3/4